LHRGNPRDEEDQKRQAHGPIKGIREASLR
jgi:hypothetical protein